MLRLRAAKGGLMCRYMRALEAAGFEGWNNKEMGQMCENENKQHSSMKSRGDGSCGVDKALWHTRTAIAARPEHAE